jgi:hypothetical protein
MSITNMTSTSGVVLMSDIGVSSDPPALIAIELSYPYSFPPGRSPGDAADGAIPARRSASYALVAGFAAVVLVVVTGFAVVDAGAVCALRADGVGFTAPFEAR